MVQNMTNETALFYLLSNNHVNEIIAYDFDFEYEELRDWYTSFLKTLSLRLNESTVQFFYNERANSFPLYIEGLKYVNHPEGMVRIAMRTLTLNVYRVEDDSMRRFVLNAENVRQKDCKIV
jgi:protein CLEC16A